MNSRFQFQSTPYLCTIVVTDFEFKAPYRNPVIDWLVEAQSTLVLGLIILTGGWLL